MGRAILIGLGVVVLLASGGCASLGGLDQAVSIDSSPRGLPVYDVADLEGGEPGGAPPPPMGRTPFFARLPRGRNLSLVVPSPLGGAAARFDFRCQVRWNSAFLGNAPLALVGVLTAPLFGAAAYGVGLGIDFATGAAYACPERYLFDPVRGVALDPARPAAGLRGGEEGRVEPPPFLERFTGERQEPERRARDFAADDAGACRRYFVIPPAHPDEAVSRALENRWRAAFSTGLRRCDSIVDIDQARSLLVRYNVTNERSFGKVSEFGVAQTNVFGLRTGATHLVLLRAGPDARTETATEGATEGATEEAAGGTESVVYEWDVYDLHSRARTSEGSSTESAPAGVVVGRPFWKRALSWTFGLFPNSVGFSFTRKEEGARAQGGRSIEEGRNRRTLPVFLSNWTLLSVYHPYRHSTWALDWDFQPQASSYFFSKIYRMGDGRGGVDPDYRVDAFYAVAIAEALGIVHSPVGSFAVGLGLGPGFIDASDDKGYTKTTMRLLYSRQFTYTAFLSENAFLRLGYQILQSGNDHFATGVVKWRSVDVGSLTIGYFLPEARSWLRSAL